MTSNAGTPSTHLPQYLSGYILGDMAGYGRTPSPRVWSAVQSQSSPKSGHRASGFSTAPSNMTPLPRNEILRNKDRGSAPPVKGLFDNYASPATSVGTPATQQMQYSSFPNHSILRSTSGILNPEILTPGSTMRSPNGFICPFQQPSNIPISPTQLDPFYTQGESLTSDEQLDDTWVTVFGFSAAAASFILEQFSQYGTITKHMISPEGNWMHIRYQSKLQAKKALSKNEKIFGGRVMVGVTRCIDVSVMDADKENANSSPARSRRLGLHHTPISAKSTPKHPTPLQPSTSAFRTINSEHEVFQRPQMPQKNNGFLSKAMEYVFGW